MIDPDFFGCSGKLSYEETRSLVAGVGRKTPGGDFSELASEGTVVTSIDRVHRCADDWDRFARIALNHAIGDVACAGAMPVQVMLSFEFGVDADDSEHAACSNAFARELAARNISLGKCHSSRSLGLTAVTIATLATSPVRLRPQLCEGSLYLSRPLGAFKLHFLADMGAPIVANEALTLLEYPGDEAFHLVRWSLVTDVSGHGLLGAVAQVAETYGLEVDLRLSADHAISPEIFERPVDCLQNSMASYGIPLGDWDVPAVTLATLRETAGPFLGFAEDDPEGGSPTDRVGLRVGSYRRGEWKVGGAWSE